MPLPPKHYDNLPRAPKHIKHVFSWLGVSFLWLCAQLPISIMRFFGVILGAILYRIMPQRRYYAEQNLRLCFPKKSESERTRLLKSSFRSLGLGLFEFMRAWWGSTEKIAAHSTITGLEHITTQLKSGRGVILLSGHFLTLEICGRILCNHVPIAGMYRPHHNRVLEWAVLRGRLRYATAMFPRHAVRACIKHLKSGGILWYAPDQDIQGKNSVFAPFFDIPACSITATHDFARLSGAAVIGFYHQRQKNGLGYDIEIKPLLEHFPSHDAIADTTRINKLIEDMVRAAPDEYLWIHRRFKRRPDQCKPVY